MEEESVSLVMLENREIRTISEEKSGGGGGGGGRSNNQGRRESMKPFLVVLSIDLFPALTRIPCPKSFSVVHSSH